ncbi:phage integrase SAM-like domain-containing protein [Salegentibacter echinorum]|uniref:phage integrase SAM-like domain-containing protein n=1 Tax=Salegentibacter echinorum TaxID=1073325 RepID=UPI001FE8E8E2|nr:phage integrase SAM-like domain-containing protein [Salegentibacter echinorum]
MVLVTSKKIKFREINEALVEKYKTFCSAYLNHKTRTITNKFIFIRTLLNIVIKDGVEASKFYPFAGDKIKIRIDMETKSV